MSTKQIANTMMLTGIALLLGVVAWLLIVNTPLGVGALAVAGVALLIASGEFYTKAKKGH